MPLKPSRRAAASLALGQAHEKALEALLLPDGEEQVEAWEEVERMSRAYFDDLKIALVESMRAMIVKEESGR